MGIVRYTVANGQILAESRDGVAKRYVGDPLGSTAALVDTTGAITDTFTYWPYGEERTRTGSTPTPFRYGGTRGYYRDSAGSTYVRARFLHPGDGRWLTRDPLWDEGIARPYRVTGANPITHVDPTGLLHCVFTPPGGVGTLNCYSEPGECFAPGGPGVAGPPWCPPPGTPMLSCAAGNRTSAPNADPNLEDGHGPLPTGDFDLGAPRQHPRNDPQFGPWFTPVEDVGNRTNIGIHGGRNGPRSRTYGCIRVSNACATQLAGLLGRVRPPRGQQPHNWITVQR